MSGGMHLRLEERERLAALKGEGLSLRAIARQLGRAASTISRELRRNLLPKGGYLPAHAEGCYLERRQRPALVERDAKLGRDRPQAEPLGLERGQPLPLLQAQMRPARHRPIPDCRSRPGRYHNAPGCCISRLTPPRCVERRAWSG